MAPSYYQLMSGAARETARLANCPSQFSLLYVACNRIHFNRVVFVKLLPAIAEKYMLHANLVALCFTESQLWSIEVYNCRNRNFNLLFCFCDLDPDPMILICELDPYSLEIHWMCKYELLRRGLRKLSSDRETLTQTRPKLYATPLGGWSTEC